MPPLTGIPLQRAVWRALADPRALRNLKDQVRRRKATLLDPNSCEVQRKKRFPVFWPSMATENYVRQFENLQRGLTKLSYTHARRAAPMLDPSIPEVAREPDDTAP